MDDRTNITRVSATRNGNDFLLIPEKDLSEKNILRGTTARNTTSTMTQFTDSLLIDRDDDSSTKHKRKLERCRQSIHVENNYWNFYYTVFFESTIYCS